MLYCADCGHRMYYNCWTPPSRPDGKVYASDENYVCGNYRNLHGQCTAHRVTVKSVEILIAETIREVCKWAQEDEKEFIKNVREMSDKEMERVTADSRNERREAVKRINELNELIKGLYEGNATGKIPDKHFSRLLGDYDEELNTLEAKKEELDKIIERGKAQEVKTDSFLRLVKKYSGFEEITTSMLNEFIDKVIVHEAVYGRKKSQKTQQIDIYFNFIGQMKLPQKDMEPIDWDKIEQEKLKAKKERKRLYDKARRQRLKAEAIQKTGEVNEEPDI